MHPNPAFIAKKIRQVEFSHILNSTHHAEFSLAHFRSYKSIIGGYVKYGMTRSHFISPS